MTSKGSTDSGHNACEPRIRLATIDDAPRIAEIYRHYVETSAATFEYVAPDVEEMRRRIASTLERYPYLVAELDETVVGFSYAGPLRSRPAYDWSCETTIYVAPDVRSVGVGRALYANLENALVRMGILSAYACVAYTGRDEDEFLTDASLRFHERMGYVPVGTFDDCGSKFGRWYGVMWMRKDLGPHLPEPKPVVPFPLL